MNYTHIPEISCFYSDTIDHAILNPCAHFEYEMILVTGGSSQAIIGHRTYSLTRRCLVFISRLERHNFVIQKTPYTRYVATMSSQLVMSGIKEPKLSSIFIQRPKEFCHVLELDESTYGLILPHFQKLEEEYRLRQEFFTTCCLSLVTSMLIDLYRRCPRYFPVRADSSLSSAVLTAQRYIGEHFHRKLTIGEAAASAYVSAHALSMAFKDISGVTFKEYLILYRITEAKKLLITTDLSISEIAEQVGYINVNNFVKIFRDREHTTPLQYRRQFAS
ncbi:MAG: helix-turn-helix transcriptional regulator [Hungatella sp.]|nr:helix-turn-helix transcriptional regulator [Hungatella sp.]